MLLDKETRYPIIEKLALALIVFGKKQRPYFQCHTLSVITAFPLKSVLAKPELSGKLVKWSVELGEFDITYQHRSALKSQLLVNFVAKLTEGERPEFPKI